MQNKNSTALVVLDMQEHLIARLEYYIVDKRLTVEI